MFKFYCMKKIAILLILIIIETLSFSQTNSFSIYSSSSVTSIGNISSSNFDNSFIVSSQNGDVFLANAIWTAGSQVIDVKKITINDSAFTFANILLPTMAAYNVRGLSVDSSECVSCLFIDNQHVLYMIKWNKLGNILWQKRIEVAEHTGEYYINSFKQDFSGNYYITISDFSFLGLIKLDRNGTLLWNKKVVGPSGFIKNPGFCTIPKLNGGCVASIKDDSVECIVNIDSTGNVESARLYEGIYRRTKHLFQCEGGLKLVIGNINVFEKEIFIQKIDELGQIVFAKRFFIGNPALTNPRFVLRDAYISKSGNIYMLFNDSSSNVVLSKHDSTGNFLWFKRADSLIYSNYHLKAGKFNPNRSDTIVFSTQITNTSSGGSNTAVYRFLDSQNFICGMSDLPFPDVYNDSQIVVFDTTVNTSILNVIVSTTTFSASSGLYYNSQNYCSFVTRVEEKETEKILVYPIPATDYINIEISKKYLLMPNCKIQIFDNFGRIVYSENFENLPIGLSNFNSGIYFLRITHLDNCIGSQKILIAK